MLRVFAPYIAGATALVGVGLYARSKLKSLNPLNAVSSATKVVTAPVKGAYDLGKKGVKSGVKGAKTAFSGASKLGNKGVKSAFKAAKSKKVQKAAVTAALATNPVGITYLAATRTDAGKKAVKEAKQTAKKAKKAGKKAFKGLKRGIRRAF